MLDTIIPAEINNDELSDLIRRLAAHDKSKNILEIGSSSGTGSTKSFIAGILDNDKGQKLFCVELSRERYRQLVHNVREYNFVRCYNMSTIDVHEFPSASDVVEFYNSIDSPLKNYPLDDVLGWLSDDIQYITNADIGKNAIDYIKREQNIANFDVVLIDGSEFSGTAEFKKVDGAGVILLDDVMTYKCYKVRQALLGRDDYKLLCENLELRHGYSAFERIR